MIEIFIEGSDCRLLELVEMVAGLLPSKCAQAMQVITQINDEFKFKTLRAHE